MKRGCDPLSIIKVRRNSVSIYNALVKQSQKMKGFLILVFFVAGTSVLVPCAAQAVAVQDTARKEGLIWLPTILLDGERLPWVPIETVTISRQRKFKSAEAKARYMRLRHNVTKVLPYAQFAQRRYDQLNKDLVFTNSKKEQKKLVKACEKEIKDMFNREIKKLSVSQGQILIKLIDRQTGNSSYEVVRDLRGGVTAFFYQSVAKTFGHNLKNKYDPEEDFEIENIIRSLENMPTYSMGRPAAL